MESMLVSITHGSRAASACILSGVSLVAVSQSIGREEVVEKNSTGKIRHPDTRKFKGGIFNQASTWLQLVHANYPLLICRLQTS